VVEDVVELALELALEQALELVRSDAARRSMAAHASIAAA
jgi:hypothetical protein